MDNNTLKEIDKKKLMFFKKVEGHVYEHIIKIALDNFVLFLREVD